MAIIRTETIQCPNCDEVQQANVERFENVTIDGETYTYVSWTLPIYVHSCVKCAYIITESEWQAPEPETT